MVDCISSASYNSISCSVSLIAMVIGRTTTEMTFHHDSFLYLVAQFRLSDSNQTSSMPSFCLDYCNYRLVNVIEVRVVLETKTGSPLHLLRLRTGAERIDTPAW